MQAWVGLLVSDVMPIYMIIPRYSHNYAQFYQLLDSNLFTHRKYLCYLVRSHYWNLWPPSLFSIILIFQHFAISIAFYFTLHLYHKNTKNIILSSLSDLTLISDREGIDNPFYRIGCEVLVCLCRCEGLVRGFLLDWYLGSQKLSEILTLLYCITLFSSRENQRSA